MDILPEWAAIDPAQGRLGPPATMTLTTEQIGEEPCPNLLVAMEDADGFVLGLGIVQKIAEVFREVTLLTPLSSLEGIDSIQLGDVVLDPQTFFDQPASIGG